MKPSEFMTKALGLRTIHEAILEGDLQRVKRILHRGKSAVNTPTIRDQVTPLHLAVLSGSFSTVRLLLLWKASFSMKDKKGYTARQYARSATLRAKKLKQYERLGWQPAKRRDKKARFISTIFREPEALRAILSTNDHPLSGSTILTDGKKLTILQKVVTTSLTFPVQNSTCGFIASYGSAVPQMMAVSGWKGEGRSSTQGVLPNERMTALVKYACNMMGFKLYMQPYDCPGASVVPPEHVGRYMASHIEKQLSTAWVLKLLQDFLETSDLARMGELKHIKLPTERSKAKIFLNHNPCDSCLGYLAKIRRVTGITFAVETIPFAVPGSRAKATVCADCAGCNITAIQPIPSSGARNSTPAAEAETDIVERDDDYGELGRQQEVDEDGPIVDFGSLVNGEDNEPQDELPVKPRADDEAQVEMEEEFTTPIRQKPTTEPTRRQVAAFRRLQGLLGTSPPVHWEVFQGQNFCAKPLKGARKRLGLNEEEFNQFLEAQSPRRFLGSPRVPLKSTESRTTQPTARLLGSPLAAPDAQGLSCQAVREEHFGRLYSQSQGKQERCSSQEGSDGAYMLQQGSEQPFDSTQATTNSSMCASLLEPVSTVNDRSVFFQTPIPVPAPLLATAPDPTCLPSMEASVQGPPVRNPERLNQTAQQSSSSPLHSSPRLEVCLPRLSSSERSQYRMIPDNEPGQLNLKRFSYRASAHHENVYPRLSGPPASSHLLERLKLRQSKGVQASSTLGSKRATKDAPATTGKPSIADKHIRPRGIRRIQERSVFAKAVRRCQENRQHQQQANSQQRGEHGPQQQEYVEESMQHGGQPVTPRSSHDTGSRQVLKSIERAVSTAPSRDGFSHETPIYLE